MEDDHIGVGLDASLPQRRDVPLAPRGFLGLSIQGALCLLLVIVQQIIHVILVRLRAIGAKGTGNARRLLDSHPLPAFGERCGKERDTELIGTLSGTEQGDVLLTQCQVHLGKIVEHGKLARIGRFQPDVGHGSGERLRVVWIGMTALALLRGPASCAYTSVCWDIYPHKGDKCLSSGAIIADVLL